MSEAASRARAALARGDLIQAYDIATEAIAAGDDDLAVRHQQVLALARMGDTERALDLFAEHGLDRSPDPHQRAVGARLLKDRALAAVPGSARDAALRTAHQAYLAIYRESGDSFPGVNAATLALLAGDEACARELAAAILADPAVAAPNDYFSAATRAEALLLLRRTDEAAAALAFASVRESIDHGARSTTARQLDLIARCLGLPDAERSGLAALLAPPRVAHYCGHMFAADPAVEASLASKVAALLEEERVGFAYGALACGSDLLFAEAALARGIELHVVLPFAEEDFITQSVRPGGESWVARFKAALARASSVTVASRMEHFGDAAEYGYGSRMAMGRARLRAHHLGGEAIQLAIWDGEASDGPAGTGADVAIWAERGGRRRVIDAGRVNRSIDRPVAPDPAPHERQLAAILFTDFAGFSTLEEAALPLFWGGVMRRVADVIEAHADDVVCSNSWGDALYAVARRAPAAAAIALELQDRLAEYDYAELGLDGGAGMRIGAHYGPAFRVADPVTGRITFYGTEVSKAARIEPVTPPGAVFVTEPFAAILTLEAGERFACRYVGKIPLAKKYGDFPMYRLMRLG